LLHQCWPRFYGPIRVFFWGGGLCFLCVRVGMKKLNPVT
jgi:hypothetical protein